MKIIFKILIIILILNQGCRISKNEINQFSASSDTLVIRTEKQKGDGLFQLGASYLNFKDTTETFPYPVIYPENLEDIKRVQIYTDFRAKEPHYVDIMSGKKDEEKIFIVDENNNNDFTDDSIRIYQKINWYSSDDLIKCRFLIFNGQKIVKDSSWIKIGTSNGKLMYGRNEHLTANFNIDKELYQVGIIDVQAIMTFAYGYNPEIALLSDNTTNKDTLLQKDILKQGEYLNLGSKYYRFDNITNNGEFITLVKEQGFDKKIGTQVGMIAPEFICKTVSGDTVKSSILHDKIIIVANSCGCGGDKTSTEAYYEILREYGDIVHTLRLDSHIDEDLEGLQIDMDDEFNRDIYNKYRNAYCSRICYVIDEENKVIDKFPIYNWKSNLPKHIKL